MEMLSAQDLRFQFEYPDEPPVVVLDGIDLKVEKGSFVALLGHNGSGKSPLAKHFNALLLPTGGSVLVEGMDTREEDKVYDIRRTVGMVLQNPDNQLVSTVVEEDVAFGPENLGVPTDELRTRVTSSLDEVGLQGFEKHETNALSGGQKQRVAIAGVLAMNPQILVLDEASAMLDPRGRRGLMRVCSELNDRGMTIVMITHFMEEAGLADRVVVLDGGKIALDGTPDEVLTQTEKLDRLNLDVPFACELSRELQKRGVPVATHVDDQSLEEELCQLLSNR